jgi:hypothetical protein
MSVMKIKVPQPPKSAMNKERPVSSLLKTQLEHIQEAEFRLPSRAQTNIYINAIKTEGEAADYIKKVTSRLHQQHDVALRKRSREKVKTTRAPFEIAAAADTKTPRKRKKKPSKKAKKTTRRTKTKRGGKR